MFDDKDSDLRSIVAIDDCVWEGSHRDSAEAVSAGGANVRMVTDESRDSLEFGYESGGQRR